MKKVILFGPLFTQAERIWNRMLKKAIEKEGAGEIKVTLPQDEAAKLQYIQDSEERLRAIVNKCLENAGSADIAVAILDGPDADSGTCIEIGYRKGISRRQLPVIGVRTDFRGSEHKGLNAMFQICDRIVYFPSFNEDVKELAQQIIAEIKSIFSDKYRKF